MTRTVLFFLLSVLVPIGTLWFAAPADRVEFGLAVAPFGWPTLLVVHCVSVVPLAAVIGRWIARQASFRSPYPFAAVGLVAAFLGYVSVDTFADTLNVFGADLTARVIARSLFALLLALPWTVAARAGEPPRNGSLIRFVVGLVVAFLFPGIFAEKLARETTAEAITAISDQRVASAVSLVAAACDVDPNRRLGEAPDTQTLTELRKRLNDDLSALVDQVAGVDTRTLNPRERLYHANALVSLNRIEEALPILRQLAKELPPVNLQLARALHQLGRYDESDEAVRKLLDAGLPEAGSLASARSACRDGYQLMAENATKRGSNTDREAVLKEALEQLPQEEAYLRFQLGRHFKMSGQPFAAIRELEHAIQLDPQLSPFAEPILRDVREATPACLVGR